MSTGTLFVKDSRTHLEYEIPIRHNTIDALALKKIKASPAGTNPADKVANGLRIYDPGLQNTAIAESKLTWIDGEKGLILFRGYSPDQLRTCDFEDIVHLMVWEKLPTPVQKESLRRSLAVSMSRIPLDVVNAIRSFPTSAAPMPMIIAGLAAYIASDPSSIPSSMGGNIYHGNVQRVDKAIIDTIAAFGVVLGLTASHRKGCKFVPPSLDNKYYDNLFVMMGHVDPSTGRPDPKKISCFRRWGTIIVDHGLSNSTFALRVTSSSLADPISSLISALAAACGPLHFGAQEAAYKTIMKVGSPENVPELIEQVKKGGHRLHGYGHRSYKTIDPRIGPVLDLLEELDAGSMPLLKVAQEIDRVTATDEYFTQRGLKANVDLYGQFFYVALGWGPEWSPVLIFAQRLPGFMAHWREVMFSDVKLLRPSELYTGPTEPNLQTPSKL